MTATSQPIAVQWLPLGVVQPDPQNPRRHSKRQIAQIARSIEVFGFNVPLLVDREHRLVAGHARLAACKLLGWTEVPVICLEHLSAEQAQAFRIADNRLAEQSSWDDELLALNLAELSALDLDFRIDVIGFELPEIELLLTPSGNPDDADPADEFPEPSKLIVAHTGDLWRLGDHRVLCADSRDPAAYERLMGGEHADVVFEDPPYNVPISGHAGNKGHVQHREFAMAAGEMSATEYTDFLRTVYRLAALHSNPGAVHFQCIDWRHLSEALAAGETVYDTLLNVAVWVKNVGGMGSLYRSRHEMILIYRHADAPHINNIQLGRFGRDRTNVWEHRSIASSRRSTDEGDLLAMHPTVKPVRMVADALLDCSHRGQLVLDAFLGSGSTLIAAQRTGRRCVGIEFDPQYVDTTIRRWQADTGGDAVHDASGETFTQREQAALQAQKEGGDG